MFLVYICMLMYMCVCIYIYTHIYVYIYMYACEYSCVFFLTEFLPYKIVGAGQSVSIKEYCLREDSREVQISWNPRGQTNPCQRLLPLTLMVLLSWGTRWCPPSQNHPKRQRGWRRIQKKRNDFRPDSAAPKATRQASREAPTCDLHHGSSFTSSLQICYKRLSVANPNLKHKAKGILGNIGQSRPNGKGR